MDKSGDNLFLALEALEKEKNIPKDYMIEKIQQALTAAYHREYSAAGEVNFVMDPKTMMMRMFALKTVADPVTDPALEISPEEAQTVSESRAPVAVGDVVRVELNTKQFGRIAAQTAKQVIIQGIRESERGAIYREYASKEQEILTAQVIKIDKRSGNMILTLPGSPEEQTFVLPPAEQIRNEPIREGDRIKVYLVGVQRAVKGPQLQISRSHPGLVKRLFEMEVPEIYDGVVEIVSVAREAGLRSKIAVKANDPNVDPVGACVGPKGTRVASIVNELRGEKIDIVKFSDDPAQYIAAALAPAAVLGVEVDEDGKSCTVVVADEQLSLAIGREGQNARLAAKLTGYRIDIKPQSEAAPGGEE